MVYRKAVLITVIFNIFLASLASALCVNVTRVSLRSGPGSKFKENWTVGKYTPLKRNGENRNGWIPVTDMDGAKHWVYSGSITESYTCVSVKFDYIILRTAPEDRSPAATVKIADRYWPAKKIKAEDDWWQLEDDFGNRYWVQESKLWRPVVYTRLSY